MSIENDYAKYMRILEIVFRTCATMLAIIFAYTLSTPNVPLSLQLYVTLLVIFLTIDVFLSGIGIIFGRKDELHMLKGLAFTSFIIMVCLIIGMLILLLVTIYA